MDTLVRHGRTHSIHDKHLEALFLVATRVQRSQGLPFEHYVKKRGVYQQMHAPIAFVIVVYRFLEQLASQASSNFS
jgi:hypothetical protein